MADEREELLALRRLAELEAKAGARPQIDDRTIGDITEGMSGSQKFLAGAGKGMTDIARGIGQLTGLISQEEIDAAKRRDEPLLNTRAGASGQMIGAVASALPTMLIPGANTLAGAVAIGAAEGALSPVASDEGRLAKMLGGAGGGAIGYGAGKALARALAPKTNVDVLKLMDEGVTPTPGQIMGGWGSRFESAAESIPFIGQGIRDAKARAVGEFNVAAINRALNPIGKSVKEAGYQGIKAAESMIDDAYDEAIKLVPKVDIDEPFLAAIDNIKQMASTLTTERAGQLSKIIDDRLIKNITDAGTLSGESAKSIQSQFTTLARGFRSSPDFDQRQLGDALSAVANEIRGLVARNSPQAAESLKKADTAFAQFVRVQAAAAGGATKEGVFTPSMLGRAIRQQDASLRKGATARGDALMQDLSDAGKAVLSDVLPNSGTADRIFANAAILGGGYAIDPLVTVAALGGRGAYTDPMQKLLARALVRRPELLRAMGGKVDMFGPLSATAGATQLKE